MLTEDEIERVDRLREAAESGEAIDATDVRWLIDEVTAGRAELLDVEADMARRYDAEVRALALWRARNPTRRLVHPGDAELLDFLLGEVARLAHEIDRRAAEQATMVEVGHLRVPDYVVDEISAYVDRGVRPSRFLECVLRHELRAAVEAADRYQAAALHDIVRYLTFFAPTMSWSTREQVEAWIGMGGSLGLKQVARYARPVEPPRERRAGVPNLPVRR